jgi:hypothetical protein
MENNLTDPYINDLRCIKRLISEWVKHKSLIIAYDYDNTVFDYHNLGYEFNGLIKLFLLLNDAENRRVPSLFIK